MIWSCAGRCPNVHYQKFTLLTYHEHKRNFLIICLTFQVLSVIEYASSLVFCYIFLSFILSSLMSAFYSVGVSSCWDLIGPSVEDNSSLLHFTMVMMEPYWILLRNIWSLSDSLKCRSYKFSRYLKCSFFCEVILWSFQKSFFPSLNGDVWNVFPLMWVNESLLADDLLLRFRLKNFFWLSTLS